TASGRARRHERQREHRPAISVLIPRSTPAPRRIGGGPPHPSRNIDNDQARAAAQPLARPTWSKPGRQTRDHYDRLHRSRPTDRPPLAQHHPRRQPGPRAHLQHWRLARPRLPTTAAGLDAAAEYVAHLDAEGREGIYLRITSLRPDRALRGRGSAADSAALPALWADLDLAGPGHAEQDLPPDEAAGRQIIADSGLPEPTIWVHSGGGLYPIWLFDQPAQVTEGNLDDLKALARDWQRVIEHAAAARGWRYGRGVGDLARVLRIPGTVNRKAGLARPCRIISVTPHRYTVGQLKAALTEAMQRIAPPESSVTSKTPVLAPGTPRDPGQLAPGEDFNAHVTWAQILEPAGWREYYRSDDITYWTRPGKPSGISASTNALGTDRLYVFSTSAAPLEGGESYSKFGAYATLYFGGDFAAAA